MGEILKINDQLMHAPVGVVIGIFAIVLGYVLKFSQIFQNKYIPLVVVIFTAILFPVVQFCADKMAAVDGAGYKVPMNLLLGFIFGGIAWLLHAQILKRFIDPKFFNEDGTRRFTRSDFPPTPPPAP